MNTLTVKLRGLRSKVHNACGAEARPVTRLEDGQVILSAVQIESDNPDHGYGVLYLTPDQMLYIHARLSQLAYAFLHENQMGGEDALDQ